MMDADALIATLELQPHPEGGWFREVYRSEEIVPEAGLPERYDGPRALATSIYFLLTAEHCSHLHRLRSDELWYFHAGSALTIHIIKPDGDYHQIRLGSHPVGGEQYQAVVPYGCWFGATVDEPSAYALVGCVVAPGFDFVDFELAERQSLLDSWPQHEALVRRLTPA